MIDPKKPQNKLTTTNTLIIEFAGIFVLVASLYWLGQQAQEGLIISWKHLILPITASAVTLAAFAANLYVRWLRAAAGKVQKPHKLLFALLCLSLLVIWVMAVVETFTRL